MPPTEYTPEQIAAMSDDELNRAIDAPAEPAQPPPAAPAPGEVPPAAPASEAPVASPAGTETPAPSTPPPAPGAPPVTLLAGKYKTQDDLAKGLVEIGKPLGIPSVALEKAVELARKTGDWSAAEAMYVALNQELSRRKSEPPPAPAPRPAAPAAAPPALDRAETVRRVVNQETLNDVLKHPMVAKLAKLGVEFPRTEEAWDQLMTDYPGPWMILSQYVRDRGEYHRQQAEAYLHSLDGIEAARTSERQTAQTNILQYAKDNGLEISEADVTTFLDQADEQEAGYVDKDGIPYPSADGYVREFFATKLRELLPQIRLAAETRGRTQAAEDLRKLQNQATSTISTAPVPSAARVAPPKVDLNDRDAVAGLSDEQLNKAIADLRNK